MLKVTSASNQNTTYTFEYSLINNTFTVRGSDGSIQNVGISAGSQQAQGSGTATLGQDTWQHVLWSSKPYRTYNWFDLGRC